MKFRKKYSLGFTLIELLVVIAIIGLLASIVLVSLRGAKESSRDTRRKADTRQIRTALELYYLDNNSYPASGGAISPNGGWDNSGDISWDNFMTDLGSYLSGVAQDPINDSSGWPGGGSYTYAYYANGYGCPQGWYMLVYKLENPDITSPGITACNGATFNYGGTITIGMCPQCN